MTSSARHVPRKDALRLAAALALALTTLIALAALFACSPANQGEHATAADQAANQELDTSRYLIAIEEEPDTVDFQCTSIHYTIATNVFDRLVETKADANGKATIEPSLAESWTVSDDGRTYTFRLREGVTFSNGSALTSSDVLYTFKRLLTHPDSCNRDIAEPIVGASQLESGEADELKGFKILGDLDFEVTLEAPFEAFLACLSMPGASILDEETTAAAANRFGLDPDCTIGTGPFVLEQWTSGKGMLLSANENCWDGPPKCAGLDLRFITEPAEARELFENGGLDILDLDEVGEAAEYFIHGDIYQDRLYWVPRVAIRYIALNESKGPLSDARVRKALQLGLNRETLLAAVYGGRGAIENGIFPHGLYGYNPDLPEIPYDPDEARRLLAEAGYPDGFSLPISITASSMQWEMTLAQLMATMWQDIGVQASIELLDEGEFMKRRKSGELTCYSATWTADYDDPDNFIYTFFGNRENSTFRSLCYQNDEAMDRVRRARAIIDPDKRLKEYRDLEQLIAQDDAAWIPLFSRYYIYATSQRTSGILASWNGSVKNEYRNVTIMETP